MFVARGGGVTMLENKRKNAASIQAEARKSGKYGGEKEVPQF